RRREAGGFLPRPCRRYQPGWDFDAMHRVARLGAANRQVCLTFARHTMNRFAQHAGSTSPDAMQYLIDEVDVAVQELTRREIDGRGAPGAALIGVGNRRLLRGHTDQAIEVTMITEGGGNTAHDAAVPGGRTRIFLI